MKVYMLFYLNHGHLKGLARMILEGIQDFPNGALKPRSLAGLPLPVSMDLPPQVLPRERIARRWRP
jgi:hypothetical protein